MKKLKDKYRKLLLLLKKGQAIQNKHSQQESLDLKSPSTGLSTSLLKTEKDTKKVHVCSDQIKKAEHRFQVSNSFHTYETWETNNTHTSY